MMRNRKGFVPKNSPIQPDYYQNIFNGWTAVFITDEDEEYHLQINPDMWEVEHGKSVSVLIKHPTHRFPLAECKTIKEGLMYIERLVQICYDFKEGSGINEIWI